MSLNQASASAKLFLCGEYSVLLGHEALIMAVDRQSQAKYFAQSTTEFWSNTDGILVRRDEDPLFLAALKACRHAGFLAQVGKYIVDTTSFFDHKTGKKLGLGSSAAALTSLCRLITEQTQQLDSRSLYVIAREANREFSRGLGSGGDIALACFGNSILFKKSLNGEDHFQPIDLSWLWPNLYFIHTQIPQDTREFVRHFLHFAQTQPNAIKLFLHHSGMLSHTFSNGPQIFGRQKEAFEHAYDLLLKLGKITGLTIVSAPHQQIAQIAQKFGGAAKPSGSGGGDICIALIEPKHRKDFMIEIRRQGFEILNLGPLKAN